MGAILL